MENLNEDITKSLSDNFFIIPSWVSFSVKEARDGNYFVVASVFLSEPGIENPRFFFLPMGGFFLTSQDAFEWIEGVGDGLLPCPTDRIVQILDTEGNKILEWEILEDEEGEDGEKSAG